MVAPPLETVRDVFDRVLNQRDAGLLPPYWAEDIVEHFPTGTCRGRDEVRRYFADLFAAISGFHIQARSIAADGNTVFVRWHMTGTFSGAWLGIEPTGAPIAVDGIDCFTFRDGLVVENFVVFDQLAFARQIGMLPAAGSAMDRGMTALFNARTRVQRLRGR